MRCTSSSARAWRRSPAMTCRSNIPTGILAEHLHTRAARRTVRRFAHGPGLARGADHAAAPRARSGSARPTSLGLAPGRQRYTQLLNDDGGILDDLMVTRAAAGADGRVCPRRQRRAQGCRFRPSRAPLCRRRAADAARRPRADRRCRARGRRGPRAPGAGRRLDDDAVHERRAPIAHSAVDRLRLPLRLYRRGRFRNLASPPTAEAFARTCCSPSPRSSRSALARAIRCGLKPAFAFTAMNSTRRPTRSRPR